MFLFPFLFLGLIVILRMPYNDFTEMPVWQMAADITVAVYKIASCLPETETFALASQMKRASHGVTSNIAEGFGRKQSKDKRHFYTMARGSVFELRNHLIMGERLTFFQQGSTTTLNDTCIEVITALNKIINSLGE
jgi:four helix bundle protein